MARPARLIGGQQSRSGDQLLVHRRRQAMLTHVVERCVVDHLVGVADVQQVKKIQPALAAGDGGEPGECVVADLRAEDVDAAVTRTGVVADPVRCLQPGTQHRAGLRKKPVLPIDQQAHDLAPGNANADRSQQRHQTLHRYLALVIVHQHERAPLWPEMAANAARQRRHDGRARRRQPALAPVAHCPRAQRFARLPPGLRSVAFSIPLGLIDGRPCKPFSRAISSRCAATSCFRPASSPSNATRRVSNSARDKLERSAGSDMP